MRRLRRAGTCVCVWGGGGCVLWVPSAYCATSCAVGCQRAGRSCGERTVGVEAVSESWSSIGALDGVVARLGAWSDSRSA